MEHEDKTSLGYLQHLVRYSAREYQVSYNELQDAIDYYEGRHYTPSQMADMESTRTIPIKFNLYRKQANMIAGHLSTVVNTVRITGQQQQDAVLASTLHDVVNYIFRQNQFDTSKGVDAVISSILSGVFTVYCAPVDTGRVDQFGRPIYDMELEHVPMHELILDPESVKPDYSDANHIHRIVWLSKDRIKQLFPDKEDLVDNLQIGGEQTEISIQNKEYRNVATTDSGGQLMAQLIHSIVRDGEKTWSIYWVDDTIIDKQEITYKKTRFPYVVYKVQDFKRIEFFGLLRDMKEHQEMINRMLRRTQQLVSSEKMIVDKEGLQGTDVKRLGNAISSDQPIIQVGRRDGVEFLNKTADLQAHSVLLQETMNRADEALGLNPAFYGQAYASDSGRKVELLQQQAVTALEPFKKKVQQAYRTLARHISALVQQYYLATQTIALVDDRLGRKWLTLNEPIKIYRDEYETDEAGNPVLDENGMPVRAFDYYYEPVLDPENNEPITDEDGNEVYAPMPIRSSEIQFFDHDIVVDTTAYDDKNEKVREQIQALLAQAGQVIVQVDPAEYLNLVDLQFQGYKTEQSAEISASIQRVRAKLAQQGGQNAPS